MFFLSIFLKQKSYEALSLYVAIDFLRIASVNELKIMKLF